MLLRNLRHFRSNAFSTSRILCSTHSKFIRFYNTQNNTIEVTEEDQTLHEGEEFGDIIVAHSSLSSFTNNTLNRFFGVKYHSNFKTFEEMLEDQREEVVKKLQEKVRQQYPDISRLINLKIFLLDAFDGFVLKRCTFLAIDFVDHIFSFGDKQNLGFLGINVIAMMVYPKHKKPQIDSDTLPIITTPYLLDGEEKCDYLRTGNAESTLLRLKRFWWKKEEESKFFEDAVKYALNFLNENVIEGEGGKPDKMPIKIMNAQICPQLQVGRVLETFRVVVVGTPVREKADFVNQLIQSNMETQRRHIQSQSSHMLNK